jgi:amino acid transporter
VLRRREPDRERRFRAPVAPAVALVGIVGCLYLFISLPNRTQIFFVCAQAIGIVLYFIYGGRAGTSQNLVRVSLACCQHADAGEELWEVGRVAPHRRRLAAVLDGRASSNNTYQIRQG